MEGFEDRAKIESDAMLMTTVSTQIQVKLIEDSFKEEEDRQIHIQSWINENGSLFRKAFNELVNYHPEILTGWDSARPVSIKDDKRVFEDTPEREKILRMILERMEEMRREKLDKAA